MGVSLRSKEKKDMQDVRLFWDTDNNNLFVAEDIFGNIYLFDTKTLKWSQMGRLHVS